MPEKNSSLPFSSPIRVVHLLRPAQGGILQHLRILIQGIRRESRWQVELAGPDLVKKAFWGYQKLPDLPFHSVSIEDRSSFLRDRRASRQLYAQILSASQEGGILHSHGYRAAVIVGLARLPKAWKWVASAHNLFPKSVSFLTRWTLIWLLKKAHRIIANSNAVAQSLLQAGVPARKIRVIPNGIDWISLQSLKPSPLTEWLDPEVHKPVVGLVARLMPDKGVDIALQAWSVIAPILPSARLLIIGEGPDREDLERMAGRLGIATKVYFLGWRKDALALLKSCHLCLIPSRREGQSLVALEAMALGVPVIASEVGGLTENVQDERTGLLVPPEDPSALAAAILRLWRNEDLRQTLVKQAFTFVSQERSANRMIQETVRVYEEVLR